MKSDETRARIRGAAIELIGETAGDVERLSVRAIAERAGVGVGLINHYFGSKENLVEVCVEAVIAAMIGAFRPDVAGCRTPAEETARVARLVMDFLMDNPGISRISILSDMKRPKAMDNTMRTVLGLGRRLSGGEMTAAQKEKAFMVVAAMQSAFLRRDVLKESLGVDFYDKAQRDAYLGRLIEGVLS